MIVEREIEFSKGWINNHPDLFAKHLFRFHKETAGMTRTVDKSRDGFITFVAKV